MKGFAPFELLLVTFCIILYRESYFYLFITFDQARALLEWHNLSRFCGRCGEKTVPKEAGRRKQCSNELCKIRVYPRVDPVKHYSYIASIDV